VTLRVGQWVRCERASPPSGTFCYYVGRVGRVAAIHRERLPGGGSYVEVGVDFGERPATNLRPMAWFRPGELQPTHEPKRRGRRSRC